MKKKFKLAIVMTIGLPSLVLNNRVKAAAVPVFSSLEINKMHASKEGDFKGAYKAGNIDNLGYWELPNTLKEVSGIKYLGNNRFACIQDEMGTIFIYNTASGKIEKEIPFGGPGDFEGIAIAGTSAYVAQSNGKIYEVQHYEGAKPVVKQYNTLLTAKHNVEGLTYDQKNHCLLLAIKGAEPRNKKYKGVYAFDLKTKRLAVKPVVKINLNDPFFNGSKGKQDPFQPSAIEIHPLTNDIYILQGSDPKLLVMDAKGRIKKSYTFNQSAFPHAEGLAFSPEGELYISNEGKDGAAATIVKVVL
ncbi:MAG TPA: SdiA-regulated domain-containing protein [Flavisolibacter sp.]|nr:SdiA-regulated domain-containing protein [Flavisolibacter sp.]